MEPRKFYITGEVADEIVRLWDEQTVESNKMYSGGPGGRNTVAPTRRLWLTIGKHVPEAMERGTRWSVGIELGSMDVEITEILPEPKLTDEFRTFMVNARFEPTPRQEAAIAELLALAPEDATGINTLMLKWDNHRLSVVAPKKKAKE